MKEKNFINLFLLLLYTNLLLKTFSYPFYNLQSTLLKNTDFIFVHKYGVDIVDYDLTGIQRTEIEFTEEERITVDKMKDVIIEQFDDGYVICLLNDRIYIFNDEGHFQYKSDKINNGKRVNYYSLTIENGESTNKYYIGILTSESLNLYYYEYNKSTNQIINIAKNENIKIINSQEQSTTYYTIENSGLNCHLVDDIDKGESLACFMIISYDNNYYWHIEFYSIDGNSIINNVNYVPITTKMNNIVKFFKVDINYDHTESLICGIEDQGKDFCFYYLNYLSDINLEDYIYNDEPLCQTEYYYKLRVDYFYESNQFVFSCLGNEHNIKYISYYVNEEDYIINDYYELFEGSECEYLNGYNLYPDIDPETNEYFYFVLFDYICTLESNIPIEETEIIKETEKEKEK